MSSHLFVKGLHGEGIHTDPLQVFDDLNWERAREKVESMPYSIGQILFHMNYWQNFILQLMDEQNPKPPRNHEEEWGKEGFPADSNEWEQKVVEFKEGLQKVEKIAKGSLVGNDEFLMDLIMHNSYHAGQVVVIRRLLGEWSKD